MIRKLTIPIIILLLFSSCEEIYTAKIEAGNEQLVVEAQLTNDISKNFVRLTKSRNYNDAVSEPMVWGAKVELIENRKKTYTALDNNDGFYYFSYLPVPGSFYQLRIKVVNDTYESDEIVMPAVPTITNAYADEMTQKILTNTFEGIPKVVEKFGRQVSIDMPVTNSLAYYRLYLRYILEYTWDKNKNSTANNPTAYGWYSYIDRDKFVLAGPDEYGQSKNIEKFPLRMFAYNPYEDLYNSDSLKAKGWIIMIDQYGTNKNSNDYRKRLNSQFDAQGNLFDPVQSQILGNITCKNDPTKIALGYFDVNSYHQQRYYLELHTPPVPSIFRQIFRYPDIPDGNGYMLTMPYLASPTPLPPPSWWE